MPGEVCDPAAANCPKNYYCALAEICTRTCTTAADCRIKVGDGCRSPYIFGQRLPDGGFYNEQPGEYCPEGETLICLDGYCQLGSCADGGCNYDLYGPSPFRGNRTQGPAQ